MITPASSVCRDRNPRATEKVCHTEWPKLSPSALTSPHKLQKTRHNTYSGNNFDVGSSHESPLLTCIYRLKRPALAPAAKSNIRRDSSQT